MKGIELKKAGRKEGYGEGEMVTYHIFSGQEKIGEAIMEIFRRMTEKSGRTVTQSRFLRATETRVTAQKPWNCWRRCMADTRLPRPAKIHGGCMTGWGRKTCLGQMHTIQTKGMEYMRFTKGEKMRDHNFLTKERLVKTGRSKIFENWHAFAGVSLDDFLEGLRWVCEDPEQDFGDGKIRMTRELGCKPDGTLVRLERKNLESGDFYGFYEIETGHLWVSANGCVSINCRDRI